MENCRRGNYTFLKTIDFSRENPADIRKLQPGAPYYFAQIFRLLGEEQTAIRTLSESYPQASPFWRGLYAKTLGALLLEQEDYRAAESLAREYLSRYSEDPGCSAIQKIHTEALYWQQQDAATLAVLQTCFPGQRQGELLLFELVSRYRLEDPGWEESFFRLCIEESSSLIHARFYRFLKLREELEKLSGLQGVLLQAKYNLAAGKQEAAIPLLKEILAGELEADYNYTSLIRELGHCWMNTGDYAAGGAFLAALAESLTGAEQLAALEMAGRLYRKQKYNQTARPLLKKVFTLSYDPDQQDRALWYYQDTYIHKSPREFLSQAYLLAPRWQDPGYFADHMHQTLSNLVAAGDWESIKELDSRLAGRLSADVKRRLDYILHRAAALGNLSSPPEFKQIDDSPAYKRGIDYYGFMDAFLAGKLPAFFASEQTGSKDPALIDVEKEQLARGYFDFGLQDEGGEYVMVHYRELSKESCLAAVRSFILTEQYQPAISLMKRMVNTTEFPLNSRDLDYLFPVAYARLIEALAREKKLAPAVLYGLVYVESAFNPLAGSSAGAMGLTQLMEETAGDMARLLKISSPDPWDAETNLRLGAHYLGRLYNLLEDLPKALMAYNAGLTRVRRWEQTYQTLPRDLMVEALPYQETRKYLTDVIEAGIMYGYIYAGTAPAAGIRMFYPEL